MYQPVGIGHNISERNLLCKKKQAEQRGSRLTTSDNDLLTQRLRFVASGCPIVEIQNMTTIGISNYPTIN